MSKIANVKIIQQGVILSDPSRTDTHGAAAVLQPLPHGRAHKLQYKGGGRALNIIAADEGRGA